MRTLPSTPEDTAEYLRYRMKRAGAEREVFTSEAVALFKISWTLLEPDPRSRIDGKVPSSGARLESGARRSSVRAPIRPLVRW